MMPTFINIARSSTRLRVLSCRRFTVTIPFGVSGIILASAIAKWSVQMSFRGL